MAKESVKTTIDANIRRNGKGEITGKVLNGVLNAMVDDYAEQDALDELKESAENRFISISEEMETKQGVLTPGENITIVDNVISANGGKTVEIVDNLYSGDSDKALSARMGKALDEYILEEQAERVDNVNTLIGEFERLDQRQQVTSAEVKKKQDALTLTVKDNGNIVLSNIQGQSKEFMPATPTGDPLHWAYVKRGAEYNDTGADIIKTAPWADLADDDADKTVVHKAGRWYLNGIGDLTTDEIRNIYCTYQSYFELTGRPIDYLLSQCVARTFFAKIGYWHTFTKNFQNLLYSSDIIVLPLYGLHTDGHMTNNASAYNMSHMCYGSKLQHILGILSIISNTNVSNSFRTATLKTLKLKGIASNISFELCSQLTLKSILYMINNEAATSAITITLHADVYAKAMEDESILSALAEHTNVSLASA